MSAGHKDEAAGSREIQTAHSAAQTQTSAQAAVPYGFVTGRVADFVRRYAPYFMLIGPALLAEAIEVSVVLAADAVIIRYLLQEVPVHNASIFWLGALEGVYWALMIFYLWPVFIAHRLRRRGEELTTTQLIRARNRIFQFPAFLVGATYALWGVGMFIYYSYIPEGLPAAPAIAVGFLATMVNAIIAYHAADLMNRVFFIPDWFGDSPIRAKRKFWRPTLSWRFMDLFLVNGVFPALAMAGVIAIAYFYGPHDPGEIGRALVAASIVGALFLGFGFVLTWLTAYTFTMPIQHMEEATRQIANHNFSARVVVQSDDQFGRLQRTLNQMSEQLGRMEMMKTLFGHYVSPEIRDLILNGKVKTDGGERLEAVVLFSDVRSFTGMMEEHSAEDVVRILNIHFSRIVSSVTGYNGFVDKFIGDAVMAVFDAEFCDNQHHLLSLCAAIEIIKGMEETNAEIGRLGFSPLRIGIGMACGPVIRGNIGSESRRELTVMGDTVNVASRLEAATKELDQPILITRDGFVDHCNRMRGVEVHSPNPVVLRGKRDPVEVIALNLSN
ncbi:MAG: adenylate/guanylate cyclase domain-containing protein [bacterium]|nr:adenylate/guanylate cyclase domain-containing protein [bacterium]